jgi:6-pyruvoyltetrahydropterin/6-carboxytetrahydropterin synthase
VAFFHAQSADGLDSLGRVIDFGVLKEKLSEWIASNWDHGFILWKQDSEAISAINKLDGQQVFVLPTNPTAENMAAYLLNVVAPAVLKGTGVVVNKVVLWETENCFVEVVLNAGL